MKRIYLDYAAATPADKRVIKAMSPYFAENFYNPSAQYHGAKSAKEALEQSRQQVAKIISAKPPEIIFTAGGTESNNLAIYGVMSQYPDAEVIVSAIEHEAVLRMAEKFNNKLVPVDSKGCIRTDILEEHITDKTALISVMLVNNEIGTLQPVKEISEVVRRIRKSRRESGNKLPIYLHSDACQAPLYLSVNVSRLGVDLMTLNGGKIYGPKQSGVLYRKAGIIMEPLIVGGGQEWGLRSGTENVAFAVGFAKALELADLGRSLRANSTTKLRDYFTEELVSRFDAEINGHRKLRIANNIHAIFSGIDNERVLFALDGMGIDVAKGSACSASDDTPSHVLLAIGKTDDQARASLRFSIGRDTTKAQLCIVLQKLKIALKA